MQKFADVAKEYEKNKDLKKEDVRALQEWVEKQPHLPKLTELDVIIFLHSCYYSNEAAKTTIDNLYTVKALTPEFFANRNVTSDKFYDQLVMLYTPLPSRTPKGETVIFARCLKAEPKLYTLPNHVKCLDMATMLSLHQVGTDSGFVLVSDMTGITMAHVSNLGILELKKFFYYLQECLPVRIKGLHFINVGTVMEKLLSIFKMFTKREVLALLHMHKNYEETLYEFVPKACLPKDYGGEAPTSEELFDKQRENFMENAEYILEEEKMIADESKRPGKPKNESDVFGIEGTFKKLEVD